MDNAKLENLEWARSFYSNKEEEASETMAAEEAELKRLMELLDKAVAERSYSEVSQLSYKVGNLSIRIEGMQTEVVNCRSAQEKIQMELQLMSDEEV